MNIIRSELRQTERGGEDFEFHVANFEVLLIN